MLPILGALLLVWLIAWLIRRRQPSPAPEPYAFTREEIASYNTALPKYMLAAAACLLLGGIHGLLVRLPAVQLWISLAGEPHTLLVEGISEQLVVGGGAVMLTMGLTCYALPNLIGRPLRNHCLARISFVLTLAGILLNALAMATIGLVEAFSIHAGATYPELRARLGAWERLPLWVFQGARDAGYVTFALLIVLTVLSSRNVIWPKHRRRLTRWLLVSAAAFFLTVVHRLVRDAPQAFSLPVAGDEPDILVHYQGHIHLHLYVGALVPVAAASFVYLLQRKAERRTDWRRAEQVLAGLALAGAAFYLTRVGLSAYEVHVAANTGVPQELVPYTLGIARPLVLSVSGLALLAALAAYLAHVAWLARATRSYLPRTITGTLVVSLALAVLAGIHGAVLAASPPVPAPASAAHHGALAVGTALLLPALALADTLLVDSAGAGLTARLSGAGLGFLGAGLLLAYLAGLGLGGPAASLAASGLQLAGLLTFALHTHQATVSYRRALRARLHLLQPAGAHRSTLALLELPRSQVLLIELLAALAGFPGFGWLFAGYALAGALLLYIGPGIAWALIPSILAVSEGWLHRLGWNVLLLYLPASAIASTLLLGNRIRDPQDSPAGGSGVGPH
ncbi:MAG: cbb3-type cytochrome c oxidase subunit I [Anaerolineae bacterium]|nr:cbb3-type cytochrome c oxidase subunit I [Anaerolineae bacterium]